MPSSHLLARGLAAALVTAALAACGDQPVTTPTARPGAPLAAVAGDDVTTAPTFAVIGPAGFQEPFTHTDDITRPVAPGPWAPATWSVVRHVRDPKGWYTMEPMMAWHGSKCEKPDDPVAPTHLVTNYEDMTFLCRNHMMTAVNASGYGVIYLTPDRMVDFTAGTAVVRFDVTTLRESGRDWIDLWVTPFAENLVTPLEDSLPDLQGEPRRAVHVRMTAERGRSAFQASVVRNFRGTKLPALTTDGFEKAFAARGLAPSATRRDTFELHISRTRIKFGMPRYNLWWVDAPVADLGWSQGVIQIGHHSFNPAADGGSATSWHWDNIGMQPAVPFTILRADRRYVDAATPNGEVTFPSGAPAGAFLRGSGIGPTEVSFAKADGKFSKWTIARLQAQERLDPRRFASAWMPIPQGTTRVRLRPIEDALRVSGGAWLVRDLSIWAPPPGTVVSSSSQDSDN